MSSMVFSTTYTLSDEPYRLWWLPLAGCLFAALQFASAFFMPSLATKFNLIWPERISPRWAFASCVLTLIWTVWIFDVTILNYRAAVRALKMGHFQVVEGPITQFSIAPYEGHANELFTVGDKTFSYSDYQMQPGFHTTQSHGGPLRLGMFVRISYIDQDILKLEVARR